MSVVVGINVVGAGGASMTVHGGSMGGRAGYTLRAREGQTGCEATEWVSDSSVRCMVGQSLGGSRRGVVTAGMQSGSVTDAWSVDGAGMSVVVGINVVGAGGASMTVHGGSMGGRAGYTLRAREGQTGCEATEWVSDSSVRCMVGQSLGGSRRGVVTAGMQSGSVTDAWSVDGAGMSVVVGINVVGAGGASMTVHGGSMGGRAGYTLRAREGQTGCEATEWVSDSSVRCMVGQSLGGSRRGVVTAGMQSGSVTDAWSVDGAGMSVVVGINVVGAGGASMTVHGGSMGGRAGYTLRAREGQTGCEATEWVSDSSVRCMVGQSLGGSRRGVVTAGMISDVTDSCMVCGWSRYERGGGDQRCRGRRSIDDGAWGEHGGQGGVHVEGSGGADGMRGDGVGI